MASLEQSEDNETNDPVTEGVYDKTDRLWTCVGCVAQQLSTWGKLTSLQVSNYFVYTMRTLVVFTSYKTTGRASCLAWHTDKWADMMVAIRLDRQHN